MSASDDSTYRVNIHYRTKAVEVLCLGINSVDAEVEGMYASTDELPEWMQLRLAALHMLEVPPPPNRVDGVGCRISPDVFWVTK